MSVSHPPATPTPEATHQLLEVRGDLGDARRAAAADVAAHTTAPAQHCSPPRRYPAGIG
jgi:hypothetical protein